MERMFRVEVCLGVDGVCRRTSIARRLKGGKDLLGFYWEEKSFRCFHITLKGYCEPFQYMRCKMTTASCGTSILTF